MAKERPILFSGEMVRAILDGRKTQTRRVIKPQPPDGKVLGETMAFESIYLGPDVKSDPEPALRWFGAPTDDSPFTLDKVKCPYGQPGDRLWVRESFYYDLSEPGQEVLYRDPGGLWEFRSPEELKGVPSIHMPRWASRITLEITDVRVERVCDISDQDVRAEGLPATEKHQTGYLAVTWFGKLWDSINAKRGLGWDANPWVWVIEFKRVEKPNQ